MQRDEDLVFRCREEFPCPYLQDGRTASIEYLLFPDAGTAHFDAYLSRGFRRLDTVLYHNCCERCASCLPIRLVAREFCPGRSQRKTLRENEDIDVAVLPSPVVTGQKVRLYDTYLRTKHDKTGEADGMDGEKALRMLHYGWSHAVEMDYYLGGRLIGVGIVDEGRNALSSNYFYYDTDFLSRRLGVFSIMQEIFLARRMKKRYYYLGFYIEETRKMAYKKYFRPNQILHDGRWVNFLGCPSGAASGRPEEG